MFDRLELLIGKDNLEKIKTKSVLVVGCGGVGGSAVLSLVRSGIHNITIVDFDTVNESNLNRQEVAYISTLGKYKVDAMKDIILDINRDVKVNNLNMYLDESNIKELFDSNNFDYVIDACDSVKTKEALIVECVNRDINLITCCGTGFRMHPEMLRIMPLSKTENDPLARILRKFVKDNHINKKLMVLCSLENPVGKGTTIASNSFVPPSAGYLLTSYVINDIINK